MSLLNLYKKTKIKFILVLNLRDNKEYKFEEGFNKKMI